MNWYSIEGDKLNIHKAYPRFRDCMIVRDSGTLFFARVPPDEVHWLMKATGALGLEHKQVDSPPPFEQVACKKFVVNAKAAYHSGQCKHCRRSAGKLKDRPDHVGRKVPSRLQVVPVGDVPSNEPYAADGDVKTVVQIPGLADFSLDGVLSVMRQRLEEILQLAATYEQSITAIAGLADMEKTYREYMAQMESHRQAVAHFLENPGGVATPSA